MEVMAVLSDRIRAGWRCITAAGEDEISSYYMAFLHKYYRTVVRYILRDLSDFVCLFTLSFAWGKNTLK